MKTHSGTIVTLLIATFILSIQSPHSHADETATDKKQLDFKTLIDRFSYAYGADLAEKFKEENIELNVSILAAAMEDAYSGGDMEMSDGEIIATLELYQKVHMKKKEAEWSAAGEKNKKEGQAFLKENAKREGVVVTESGLQYRIITPGNGEHSPTAEDEVKVHYRGTFVDGTEFDSTHKRNEAYSVKVKQLIQGWSEALQLMSEGAKWELYIPADIAYGEKGSGNFVGPNAVLIFEVELLEIENQKG